MHLFKCQWYEMTTFHKLINFWLIKLCTAFLPLKTHLIKKNHSFINMKLYVSKTDCDSIVCWFLLWVCIPVDDTVLMQEHKRRCDLSCIETGTGFIKLSWPLDLKHQVSSIHILHNKEQPILETEKEYKKKTKRLSWFS